MHSNKVLINKTNYRKYDVPGQIADSECAHATVASHYDTLKVLLYKNKPNYTLILWYKVSIAIDWVFSKCSIFVFERSKERDEDSKKYIRERSVPVRFDTLHEASEVINILVRTDALAST